MLINLIAKARAKKELLLYEFPFSLNPSDMPIDAMT